MTHINTALTEKLAELTDGLFWMSESDYPWQVFAWETSGPISHDQLLQLTHHPAGTFVAEVDLDEFFTPALTQQNRHREEERPAVKKYQQLVEFLKYSLSDITVYRLGRVPEFYIYIVGVTRDDNLAGLITQVIET